MALSFIFDAGKGETPQSVAQKRALVQQLLGTAAAPKTFGEGLSALGDGIVANVTGRRASEAESKGQAGANDTFSALTAMLTGKGGAMPPAGFAGAPASVPTGADAASIREGMIARGLPEHIADGFLMNMQDESGLNPGINEQNPTVPGSRGGYGLYQLTGPRRVAYEQYAQQLGVDPSNVDAQLDFMMSELQGPEANAAKSIFGTQDAGSAAAAIATNFLRPAKQHLDARVSRYTGGGQAAPVQVASLDPVIGMPQAQPAQLPPIGPSGAPQMAAAPQQPGMVPQMPSMQPQAPMAPQQQPMQTAQGPSLEMLMQAAANPWLNEGQRGIVNSMIAQEMQRMDPAYQQGLRAGDLGIQKSELELEKLRNPAAAPIKYEVIGGQVVAINPNDNSASSIGDFGQPDPGYRLMTPEELQSVPGLDPRKAYQVGPDNKISEIGGGGVNVTVGGGPEMGKLSTDYGYVMDPATGLPKIDPETGLPTAAPVPGSPAAVDAERRAQMSADQTTQRNRYADVVIEDVERALGLVGNDTAGIASLLTPIPGSNARNLDALLTTVKANVGFDRLQAMREASPTGGALGAVSDFENRQLQSTLGNLEQTQTPEQLTYNLQRFKDTYLDIIHGPGNRPENGGGKPDMDYNAASPPEGWGGDPSLWKFLSPEDRALW